MTHVINKYTLQGTLFNSEGDLAGKQRFHIYQDDQFLAYGKSRSDGTFTVQVPLNQELDEEVSLVFRETFETKLAENESSLRVDERLVRNLSFLRDREEKDQAIENIRLDSAVKDIGEVHFESPYENESVPLSYYFDLFISAVPARLKSLWVSFVDFIDYYRNQDVGQLLDSYNVDRVEMTGSNLWKLLTNGICPIYFKDEGDFLVAEVNWDKYEFDKLGSLANTRVCFSKSDEGDPTLELIEVSFRETLQPSGVPEDRTEVAIYTPGDDNFEEGLRIAGSAFNVLGQTVFHLSFGHVYGTQVAMSAHDFLVGHKLGELILPHCQFIRKISHELGKAAIFGEDGVLNASALSAKGIAELISDSVGSLDPFSFEPRSVINENHKFAEAQQHHFAILQEAVHEYFDENWEEMTEDWTAVHSFFYRLFKRLPEHRPWAGDRDANWRDVGEIGGYDRGLPEREPYKDREGVQSFRHIAKDIDRPEPQDRDLIEKFVVDFIHHVTIWHSWIHRSQYQADEELSPNVLDVSFSPISLENYGEGPYGGMKTEDAKFQLRVTSAFSAFDVGNYRLLENPLVYSGITDRVEAATVGYLTAGIRPDEIQFGTVI